MARPCTSITCCRDTVLICICQSSWLVDLRPRGSRSSSVASRFAFRKKCRFSFLTLEEMTSPSLLFQMMINLLLCELSCPCDHVLHHTVSFNPSYSSVCSMHSKSSTGSFYVLFPLWVVLFFSPSLLLPQIFPSLFASELRLAKLQIFFLIRCE